MPTINKPALRNLCQDLVAKHQQDPAVKIDAKVLDQIVAIIGDSDTVTSDDVAAKLRNGNLLPEEKLALARAGLDDGEKADVQALLADTTMTPLLDPVAQNFLKALVGIEPLQPTDGVGATSRVDTVGAVPPDTEIQAVESIRKLIKSGQLKQYYDAAIGIGSDPALKAEALKVFNALPKITAATKAEDMVKLGLWSTAPRGIEAMQKSARYLPGRPVMVKTNVNVDFFRTLDFKPIHMFKVREDGERQYFRKVVEDPNGSLRASDGKSYRLDGDEKSYRTEDLLNYLEYDADGPEGITYRATIADEDGDNFLVEVDGKDEPISVPKTQVFELNQPQEYTGDEMNYGKHTDYNDPLMKAKVAEAAIKMDELVGKLDFTKAKTEEPSGRLSIFGHGRGAEEMVEIQKQCVQVVHDAIDMRYPGSDSSGPGRTSGREVGRQAVRGVGSCYEQASVMLGMLVPFHELLGVDVRFVSGSCYRDRTNTDRPFGTGGHGWLQLTYRPSMQSTICDRTWAQPNHPMDKAYSFWGDRYPGSTYGGAKPAELTDTDLNFTGDVSVADFERQFGEQGDGRENHV